MRNVRLFAKSLITLVTVILLNACENTPPPHQVSFSKDIQPILQQHCLECHDTGGEGALASGLNLSSYENVMHGTKFGPILKAGDSLSSTIIILVEGRADASINMPHGNRPPLSKDQTQTLRQWIDQGALNN